MTSSKNYIMQTSYLATYNNSSISVSNLNGTFYLDNGGYLKQGTNGICYYSSTGILIKDLSSELGNSISLTNWFTDLNNMFITFNGSALKSYYVTENDFTEANITQVGSINKFIVTTEGILLISSDSKTVHYFKQSDSTVSGLVYKQTRFLSGVDKTAVESDILYGKTAVGMNGSITGTMNNLGDLSIIPNTTGGTISSGFVNSINIAAVTSSIDPNITANNIANGVNILGITGVLDSGTNTQDANATASDLVYGKTAYVNGVKITGSMNIEDLSNELNIQNLLIINLKNQVNTLSNTLNNAAMVNVTNLGDINIIPNTIGGSYGSGLVNSITINPVTASIDSNITANNIANGVNILGVVGTYEGSGGGSQITPEMKFGYSTFTDAPNIDTSNYSDTGWMFYGCQQLNNVPNYNMSNVQFIDYMFTQCTSIAPALNTIANFDLNNVTSARGLFAWTWSGLTDAPNLYLPVCRECVEMFAGCSELVNVPQINIPNAQTVDGMFAECFSLSNASIQNIINMLLNAPNIEQEYRDLDVNGKYSPFRGTPFDNSYYQNRWSELTQAGWNY